MLSVMSAPDDTLVAMPRATVSSRTVLFLALSWLLVATGLGAGEDGVPSNFRLDGRAVCAV
jgi:hypothetical protein